MSEPKLQTTEIQLWDIEDGWVNIEPADNQQRIQLQLASSSKGLQLCNLSPREAHEIGNALIKHALEYWRVEG